MTDRTRYFKWLVRKVANGKQAREYSRLLEVLDSVDFIYIQDKDENRLADAIDNRAQYEYDNDIPRMEEPISLFEVLASLAIRCEEGIMGDWDKGDRTSKWFWIMINNSGLYIYNNKNFDKDEVRSIINRILTRKYNRDGSNGGLFYIPDTAKDLRKVDIWTQLMWWLTRYED